MITATASANLTWSVETPPLYSSVFLERLYDSGSYSPLSSFDINTSSYIDSPLEFGTLYSYRTYSSNSFGKSDYSSVVNIETPYTVSIVSYPSDLTINSSSSVTMSVVSTGSLPITYQWQKFDVNLTDSDKITGSSENILTINNVTEENTGSYRVLIGNLVSNITGSEISLSLNQEIPTSIDDIYFWVKADSGVYSDAGASDPSSDGDQSVYWSDQSSFRHDMTSGAGLGPIYKTNIINSLPVLRFSRLHGRMANAAISGAISINTVTILLKSDSDDNIFIIGSTYASNDNGLLSPSLGMNNWVGGSSSGTYTHDGLLKMIRNEPDSGTSDGPSLTTGQWSILTGIFNSSSSSIRLKVGSDDPIITNTDSGTSPFWGIGVGLAAGFPQTDVFTGDVAEIIAYNRVLNDTEIATIESYLQQKYNL